ncbi:MAG: hypothetical protein K6T83_01060 [Alicyclobacillus sp.]|nr:hypothetical protein [Alicyclobacillus sp.]
MAYVVEHFESWVNGGKTETQVFSTIEEARNYIRGEIGNKMDEWKCATGNDEDIEAYNDGPGEDCGGYVIREA